MEAARKLAELLERERKLFPRPAEDLRRRLGIDPEPGLGEPEGERERDEALLGAVVEVPLEPPPLGVGRVDEARARPAQLFLVALSRRDVQPTDQVVLRAVLLEGRGPPLDDDLAAVCGPPRRLGSSRAATLDGGEKLGARAFDLVLRHHELPERTPDRRFVADAGRDLERRVHATFGDNAVRIDDAQERGRRVPDEVEKVPFALQLVCVADALADVGTGQHEAEHALAVLDRGQRPRDVDLPAAGGAEEVLLLAVHVRDHAFAEPGSVLRRRENLPDEPAPRCVVVRDAGGPNHRLVEADDAALEIEDAEEGRCRVHDVAHEVALALELVEAGAELRLEAVAMKSEPRCDGNRED